MTTGEDQVVPHLATSGFTSFNVAAFQAQQAQAVAQNVEQLVERYLQVSSSSDDEGRPSSSDDEGSPGRGGGGQVSGGVRHAEASSSDSSSDSGRKRKRSKKEKHSKHSKKRTSHAGSKHKRAKVGESEKEKVLRLERQLAAQQGTAARTLGRPAVDAAFWQGGGGQGAASGAGAPKGDTLYYDTRGDLQNLVYKQLYARDMAAYARRDPLGLTPAGAARLSRVRASQRDGEVQQSSRYFHAAIVLAERSRATPRVRLRDRLTPALQVGQKGAPQRTPAPLPAYIPLVSLSAGRAAAAPGQGGLPQAFGSQPGASSSSWRQGSAGVGGGEDEAGQGGGETIEQWVLRRTRELNMATRERPHDVGLWLQLASFQDEVSRVMGRRAGRRNAAAAAADAAAVAEKKVSILERALEHNPDEVSLLVSLLEAAGSAGLLDPPTLVSRWERAIRRWQQAHQHLGTSREGEPSGAGPAGVAVLWQRYLLLRQRLFPTYTYQQLLGVYIDALASIGLGLARAAREEGGSSGWGQAVVMLERAGVRLALDSILASLQTGHNEHAVGCIQAVIEFLYFSPAPIGSLGLSSSAAAAAGGGGSRAYSYGAQLRLFASYWESGAPRIGEEGSSGWAAWFRAENRDLLVGAAAAQEQGQQGDQEEEEQRDKPSWSGWVELPGTTAAPAAHQQQQQPSQNQEPGVQPLRLTIPLRPARRPGQPAAGQVDNTGQAGGAAAGVQGGDPEGGAGSEQQQTKVEDEGQGGAGGADSEGGGGGQGEEAGEEGEGDAAEAAQEEDEAQDDDDEDEGVDEAKLLEELGMRLEQELEGVKARGLEPRLLSRWLREEGSRSSRAVLPHRESGDHQVDPGSVVSVDDVRHVLLPITLGGPRDLLLLGCLSLLGAPLGPCWAPTNTPLLLQPEVGGQPPLDLAQQMALRQTYQRVVARTQAEELISEVLTSGAALHTRPARRTSHAIASHLSPAVAALTSSPPPVHQLIALQQQQQQQQQGAAGARSTMAASMGLMGGDKGPAGVSHLSSLVSPCLTSAFLSPITQPPPWYAASEERRSLLARLLRSLVAGGPGAPLSGHVGAALALLLVEATQVAGGEGSQSSGHQHQLSTQLMAASCQAPCELSRVDRARETAKALLGVQRTNLVLWGAYAQLELMCGGSKASKVARRVFDSALAAAHALPLAQRQPQLPQLVLAAAQMEVDAADSEATGRLGAERQGGQAGGGVKSWEAAVTEPLCRAFHMLLWFLNGACAEAACAPYKPCTSTPTAAQVTAARMGFARLAPALLQSACAAPDPGFAAPGGGEGWAAGGPFDMSGAAVVASAALLEVLSGRLAALAVAAPGAPQDPPAPAAQGPPAWGSLQTALAVAKNSAGRATESVRRGSVAHEWLAVWLGQLVVVETSGGVTGASALEMPPTRVRDYLCEALALYPHNVQLLHLLVLSEQRAHAHARLRQFLTAALSAAPTPSLLAATIALEAANPGSQAALTAGRGALSGRIHSLLEQAASDKRLSSCPDLWRVYLRYEQLCGRGGAVRRVLLRAVRECPGAKDLVLTGLAAAAAYAAHSASEDGTDTAAGQKPATAGVRSSAALTTGLLTPVEASELVTILGSKGVRVLTDVAEAVMLELEEEAVHG